MSPIETLALHLEWRGKLLNIFTVLACPLTNQLIVVHAYELLELDMLVLISTNVYSGFFVVALSA